MVPMAGMSFDLFEEEEFVSDLASSLSEHTPAQENKVDDDQTFSRSRKEVNVMMQSRAVVWLLASK